MSEGEISAHRTPPKTAKDEDGQPVAPLPKQRPKMTLDEQATFLSAILRRCVMHGPQHKGVYAGQATLALTEDDMLRLETIQQTLAIFDVEGAAELVRREIWRKRQKGSGRG